ncbi:haloacid dehalogenase type II, partial [Achromobacter xylosoxidans]|nr:haloacid dehalogenase type II [Achromobacter xylosoxidans]
MPLDHLPRPQWLTFDCYGTLIQWDEGLQAAVARILAAN